jgi:hypothetical protein
MSAKQINLVLEQGTDFESTFTIYNENGTRLNLTNYTGLSLIKKSPYSSVSYPFTLTFPNRLNGQVRVSMAKIDTSAIEGGRYVYDVVLTSPNNTTRRVVQGSVLVIPGVSL